MIKDYRVQINAGETVARGSSPRVAIGRALDEQYAAPNRFRGANCALDYQLKLGETLTIKCTRIK